jgi:hypothetical protein
MQFAAGLDLRANSHDQVEKGWRVDYSDRGARESRLSVRRLSATLTSGRFTLDAGKQFIRWGKTDIVTPTDRFAPREFLIVLDAEWCSASRSTMDRRATGCGGDSIRRRRSHTAVRI